MSAMVMVGQMYEGKYAAVQLSRIHRRSTRYPSSVRSKSWLMEFIPTTGHRAAKTRSPRGTGEWGSDEGRRIGAREERRYGSPSVVVHGSWSWSRASWTDQLRRDNNNVPTATLWRQAIGRGHSRATLRFELTTRQRRWRRRLETTYGWSWS